MNKKLYMFLLLNVISIPAILGMESDIEREQIARYERGDTKESEIVQEYHNNHSRWEQIKDPEIAKEMLKRGEKPPKDILHIVARTDYHPKLVALYRPFADPLLTYDEARKLDMGPDFSLIENSRLRLWAPRDPDLRLPIHILALMVRGYKNSDLDMKNKKFKVPTKFYDSKADILMKYEQITAGLTDAQLMQMFKHKASEKHDIMSMLQQEPVHIPEINWPDWQTNPEWNQAYENHKKIFNQWDPRLERRIDPKLAFAHNDAQFAETAPILLQRIKEKMAEISSKEQNKRNGDELPNPAKRLCDEQKKS